MKHLLLIISLLTLTIVPTHAQTEGNNASARPKVAVVLSGGGAKGVAHISALRAIEEAGLPIDIITGTSMGSLIGGLYAVGWSTDELDSLVRSQDWPFLLSDRVNPESVDIDTRRLQNTYALWHAFTSGKGNRNSGAGFIRGTNLDHLFDRLLEGYLDSIDFNTLPIPFACVATDVITNTEVDFHSGYLKQAMRASMSIPGVFSPVRMGDRLLVDGGLRNNYPADIARQMGADIIIGVTVQGDTLVADDVTGPIELLMQVIDINCKNKYNDNIAMSDIVMHVDVSGYSAASFTAAAIDTLLRRGAEEAARHRDELLALRDNIAAKRARWDSRRSSTPTSVDPKEAKSSYKLTAQPTPLLYNPVVGVAFRFDNEETGALQIGARFPFQWGIPMEVNGHLRLGKRIQFHVEQFLYPRGITSPSLSYTFFRNDIDIYSDGIRTYNSKYNQHRLSLMPINSRFRKYKLRAGILFDYFDFYDPILSAGGPAIVVDDSRFFSYHFESIFYTENDYYTPTRGIFFTASYTYRTDNLFTYLGKPGISEVRTIWRNSFSFTDRFTLSPCLIGRLVFSEEDTPLPFANAIGSYQSIVDQQLAFPGVHSLTYVDPLFVAAQLRLQFNIHKNQYVILRAAIARESQDFEELLQIEPNIYGFSLGYCYNSFLGPISADLGYSTLAPSLNFYLNIGHYF